MTRQTTSHPGPGRPRKYSDRLVQRVLSWRTKDQLCAELGITKKTFNRLRVYEYKRPCP